MTTANPREIAYKVLGKVDDGSYADLALDAELGRQPRLDPRDRGLATELAYGVLRQRGRLDYALAHCCRQPLAKLEAKVLRLLRLGAYQLLCLDRVPPSAAVNTTVELARQQGLERATGFINGVLRGLLRSLPDLDWPDPQQNPRDYLVHGCSLPLWLAKRWLGSYPNAEAIALGEALLQPAPLTIRVNTLCAEPAELLETLRGVDPEARPCRYLAEGIRLSQHPALQALAPESYQVQDQASMLVPHLLGAAPGDRILDSCAAPGGKTTQLAALAGNRAEIVALELHPHRLKLLRQGIERLGCAGVMAKQWDLTQPPEFLERESFDKILLDAPCSGLGVLRRNPETRWTRQPGELKQLARLQLQLLQNLVPLLKPGGRLVYSLCTNTVEESSGVLEQFLQQFPQFEIEDRRGDLPQHWQELFDEQGCLRTLPHRHDDMDAFFAVALRRRG